MIRTALLSFALLSAFSLTLAAPASLDVGKGGVIAKAAFAKNGADDPAGHDAGDDRGRNRGKGGGADDRAGHR